MKAIRKMKVQGDDALLNWMDTLDVSTKHTHQKLLARLKNPADMKAWNQFYICYYELIISFARAFSSYKRLRLSESDIEDVACQVLNEIGQKMGDFEYKPGKRAFRGYLATIVHRRCIDARRVKDARPGSEPLPVSSIREIGIPSSKGSCLGPEAGLEDESMEPHAPEDVPLSGLSSIDGNDSEPKAASTTETDRDDISADKSRSHTVAASTEKADPAGKIGQLIEARRKKENIIHEEFFGDHTGEITKLIQAHDMEMGRTLALEKLRANTENVSARQFQIYEKLVMGVPVADICSQLAGVNPNQVSIARSRVGPFYEKALHEAKQELDSPQELPPPFAK